jgi:hypothetical protein
MPLNVNAKSGTVYRRRPQNTTVWTCASGARHRQSYRRVGGCQGQHIVRERRNPTVICVDDTQEETRRQLTW